MFAKIGQISQAWDVLNQQIVQQSALRKQENMQIENVQFRLSDSDPTRPRCEVQRIDQVA
jgi:hypothetical protein